jgi:riboflavin kinase/FMN adenylyltransferase
MTIPASSAPRPDAGAVVTVGTFDGVHRGHREVLDDLTRRAELSGRRSVLVTFHPHPLRIVRPEAAPPLLTPTPEKKLLLAESGVQHAVILPFTRELQQLSARDFVVRILLARLGMRELVIGYDHGFGRGREGSVETMRELGEEMGFAVDVVDAVRLNGEPVSSTRIRQALAAGDVREAARCLGRPYSLEGSVVHGQHRGRELGFPTANIAIADPEKMLPLAGIYAVFGWVGERRVPGLLHLGPRPTFPGDPPTVELYLMDFSGDLYGRELRIELCHHLREILPFDSVEALVAQMREDEVRGRALLLREGPRACAELRGAV